MQKKEEKESANMLVPINNYMGQCPVYVNAKQYDAILRRRMKKIRRDGMVPLPPARSRVRYTKRSLHAKRRERGKDGKFVSKLKSEESTIDTSKAKWGQE